MDGTVSASQAARELGTSVPRVVRAIDRLGLDVGRSHGGRVGLRPAQLEQLRRELGVTPHVPGLSRTQTLVLAALVRAPLGLVSARAVAARAGVSPTAAGKALWHLEKRRLMITEVKRIAAGRVREARVYRINVTAPGWPELAPQLAAVRPPQARPRPPAKRVPDRLRHLFWNVAPAQLEVASHGGFIARRLLTAGDFEGLAWGAKNLAPGDWIHASHTRGIDVRQRVLAENLAAQDGTAEP